MGTSKKAKQLVKVNFIPLVEIIFDVQMLNTHLIRLGYLKGVSRYKGTWGTEVSFQTSLYHHLYNVIN